MVGMLGASGLRSVVVTASALSLPSMTCGSVGKRLSDRIWMSPASAACSAGPAPRNGTCTIFSPGQLQQPGHGEVRALPDAGGTVGQLVRIGLDVGHHVGDRLDRHRGVRRDDVGNPDQVGDRLQLVGLVGHVPEDAVGDGVGAGIADQDGVPVALLADDFGGADGAAAAGAVLHHRGLAPRLLQMGRQQPSHHVRGASRRGRHDQADGFGGPPVGAQAGARQNGRSGERGGSGQNMAAGKKSAGH